MQGMCVSVATFSLILVAGKGTWWQKKLVPAFLSKIRGKSWKFIWKILKRAEMFFPYEEVCLIKT